MHTIYHHPTVRHRRSNRRPYPRMVAHSTVCHHSCLSRHPVAWGVRVAILHDTRSNRCTGRLPGTTHSPRLGTIPSWHSTPSPSPSQLPRPGITGVQPRPTQHCTWKALAPTWPDLGPRDRYSPERVSHPVFSAGDQKRGRHTVVSGFSTASMTAPGP
jgi:hypothetical protein